MKSILKLGLLLLLAQNLSAQSLDYISIRKKNNRVVKNIYSGSQVLLQTTDNSYLHGPVEAIRHDSLYVRIFDVRTYATVWGTRVKDTISNTLIGLHKTDIKRVHLGKRTSFLQRTGGPLLMLGGAGYTALNLLNGAFLNEPIADKQNRKRLGIAAGLFGVGFLLQKLFATDGFSKESHRLVYVDL